MARAAALLALLLVVAAAHIGGPSSSATAALVPLRNPRPGSADAATDAHDGPVPYCEEWVQHNDRLFLENQGFGSWASPRYVRRHADLQGCPADSHTR